MPLKASPIDLPFLKYNICFMMSFLGIELKIRTIPNNKELKMLFYDVILGIEVKIRTIPNNKELKMETKVNNSFSL